MTPAGPGTVSAGADRVDSHTRGASTPRSVGGRPPPSLFPRWCPVAPAKSPVGSRSDRRIDRPVGRGYRAV